MSVPDAKRQVYKQSSDTVFSLSSESHTTSLKHKQQLYVPSQRIAFLGTDLEAVDGVITRYAGQKAEQFLIVIVGRWMVGP